MALASKFAYQVTMCISVRSIRVAKESQATDVALSNLGRMCYIDSLLLSTRRIRHG